jgi:phosphoribosylformimino-5-aminoimidazole carboxamide ribotide isomerase
MNMSEKITLIPAIDIIDGKCVRLEQGDYNRKTEYAADPLEMAKQFEAAGVKRLHVVDLDGAKAGRIQNMSVLERIATQTTLQVDFGGGVKTRDDVKQILVCGAALVTIGSIAVKAPETVLDWFSEFGAASFFLGADVRDEKLAVNGWLEQTDRSVYDLVNYYCAHGLQQVFCTDIAKDGLLAGPATALYRELLQRCPGTLLTASGGVSGMHDVAELQQAGCAGVIIGKAIYEGKITMEQIQQFNTN